MQKYHYTWKNGNGLVNLQRYSQHHTLTHSGQSKEPGVVTQGDTSYSFPTEAEIASYRHILVTSRAYLPDMRSDKMKVRCVELARRGIGQGLDAENFTSVIFGDLA